MSIVTKTGDKGMTSLYMGGRVRKDDPRVDLYGTLDELCSFLGMSKCLVENKKVKNIIENIQKNIFTICTELATKNRHADKLKKKIDKSSVNRIEEYIKDLETKKMLLRQGFCVPGKNFISSTFDIARTVARRVERKIVTLARKKVIKNEQILIYINRLSDLLFLLARLCEEKKHVKRSTPL